MKVFTVLHGERHEGGSILSVHKDKKDAIISAQNVRCAFPGGWVADIEEINYWENGCDFVHIQEWDVQ